MENGSLLKVIYSSQSKMDQQKWIFFYNQLTLNLFHRAHFDSLLDLLHLS